MNILPGRRFDDPPGKWTLRICPHIRIYGVWIHLSPRQCVPSCPHLRGQVTPATPRLRDTRDDVHTLEGVWEVRRFVIAGGNNRAGRDNATLAATTKRRYATDLTDEQWELIRPLVERERQVGRPTVINLREVVSALLYLTAPSVGGGCSPRTSRTGIPCATTSITGASMAPLSGSMMCCASGHGCEWDANRSRVPGSSTVRV